MKIHPNGYWENPTAEGHGVDSGLCDGLVTFFTREHASSVLDVGCGNGYYTYRLNDAGIYTAGYDGNPNTPIITNGLCSVHDFTSLDILGYFDWVLCLEVGEHIPEHFEFRFIANLMVHAKKGIVLSWAIPGQGGDGHVNCRDNQYIKDTLLAYHFKNDLEAEKFLRDSVAEYPKPCYWFRDTLMVFRYER